MPGGSPRRPGQRDGRQRAQPARHVLDGLELGLGVGDPFGRRRGGEVAGRLRVERPAQRARQERGDRPSIARVLVQPRVLAARDDQRLERRRIRLADPGRASGGGQPREMADRDDGVLVAVRQQDRPLVPGERRAGADLVDVVAARTQVDPRREPGQRVGDRVGQRQPGEIEGQPREAVRAGRAGGRNERGDPRVGGRRQDRPDAAHRMADDPADRHLGLLDQRAERRQRIVAELAGAERQVLGRVGAVAAHVEGQAVEPGRMEEHGQRQRPVARRLPAVDEHDARPPGAAAGGDEPGREGDAVGVDPHRLIGEADVRRRHPRRLAPGVAGPHPVGQREAIRQPDRGGGDRGGDPDPAEHPHAGRGRHPARAVKSGAARALHSADGQARPARRPRCGSGRDADPDQGRLAPPGAGQPSRPDRRRSGCLAHRDAADGRDQRGVRGAHPPGHAGGARRDGPRPTTDRPSMRASCGNGEAARRHRSRPVRSPAAWT